MRTSLSAVFVLSAMLSSFTASAHDFALREVKVKIARKSRVALAASGNVLYTFEEDLKGERSNCVGKCAEIWPPVLLSEKEVKALDARSGKIEIRGIRGGKSLKEGFGVLLRGDGVYQLTFNGWPLYAYAYDRSSDDAYGDEHNPGGVSEWYAFTSDFRDHD